MLFRRCSSRLHDTRTGFGMRMGMRHLPRCRCSICGGCGIPAVRVVRGALLRPSMSFSRSLSFSLSLSHSPLSMGWSLDVTSLASSLFFPFFSPVLYCLRLVGGCSPGYTTTFPSRLLNIRSALGAPHELLLVLASSILILDVAVTLPELFDQLLARLMNLFFPWSP